MVPTGTALRPAIRPARSSEVSMNSRDRVMATFEGEPIDRVARVEYYWTETIRQWSLQGLGGVDREGLQYLFGHDLIYFYFDPRFGFEERVVSEDRGIPRHVHAGRGNADRSPGTEATSS